MELVIKVCVFFFSSDSCSSSFLHTTEITVCNRSGKDKAYLGFIFVSGAAKDLSGAKTINIHFLSISK